MRLDQNSLLSEYYLGTECCSLREARRVSTSPTILSIDRARKTNRTLPILLGALIKIGLSVGIVFSAVEARGQYRPLAVQPPTQIFPWGSTNALIPFAVTNTQNMGLTVYQGNNGNQAQFPYAMSFSSFADINTAFQQLLVFAANLALTNPAVNKNDPIFVIGNAVNLNYPPGFVESTGFVGVTFVVGTPVPDNVSFSYVEQNGTWVLPDLSGIVPVLPQQMTFYVPGLEWARIEVYNSTNMITPFLVVDSRNPSSSSGTNGIDLPSQSITIATAYLASGTNGPYQLKVSFLTSGSGFQIVDGNGLEIAETPLVLAVTKSNGSVNLSVTGGDVGRNFEIEKSPDLQTWTPITGAYTVGTNAGWSITFQDTMSNLFGFYRAATTNAVPQ
jgi:hypothetical protein